MASTLATVVARLKATAGERDDFAFDPHAYWKFGSHVVPGTSGSTSLTSPLKIDEQAFSIMKPTAYNAKPEKGHFLVEVQRLSTWQNHVDPAKLRPLPANVRSLEPIEVRQVDGQLVVWNGNHRAVSAFVEGTHSIVAVITNFDDARNLKYRKDSKTAEARPLSPGARPL